MCPPERTSGALQRQLAGEARALHRALHLVARDCEVEDDQTVAGGLRERHHFKGELIAIQFSFADGEHAVGARPGAAGDFLSILAKVQIDAAVSAFAIGEFLFAGALPLARYLGSIQRDSKNEKGQKARHRLLARQKHGPQYTRGHRCRHGYCLACPIVRRTRSPTSRSAGRAQPSEAIQGRYPVLADRV